LRAPRHVLAVLHHRRRRIGGLLVADPLTEDGYSSVLGA
jgi:hypothetical protein